MPNRYLTFVSRELRQLNYKICIKNISTYIYCVLSNVIYLYQKYSYYASLNINETNILGIIIIITKWKNSMRYYSIIIIIKNWFTLINVTWNYLVSIANDVSTLCFQSIKLNRAFWSVCKSSVNGFEWNNRNECHEKGHW